MRMLEVLSLVVIMVLLSACGLNKKIPVPKYYEAKEGELITLPGLQAESTLLIPSSSMSLGEYDGKLVKPPNLISPSQ